MTAPPAAPTAPTRLARAKPLRLIVLLLAWLIAGAALNVAVAWGMLLLTNPFSSIPTIARQTEATWLRQVEVHERAGTVVARSRFLRHNEPDLPLYMEGPPLPELTGRFSFRTESDLLLVLRRGGVLDETYIGAGWPCLALHGESEGPRLPSRAAAEHGIQPKPIHCGIPVADQCWPMGFTGGAPCIPKVLPYGLLWPGFAINTLFYAGVLWGLWATPFALRRMIRRRRGQCPRCAYPIGTSEVCTECGADLTP